MSMLTIIACSLSLNAWVGDCDSVDPITARDILDPVKVREIEPTGDAFTRSLHNGYAGLTEKEASLYDWPDAWYFAAKARAAAGGKAVAPARPEEWDVPAEALAQLAGARTLLVAAVENESVRRKASESLARAQVMFDCWVEELEENTEPQRIAACRSEFERALVNLVAALRVGPPAPLTGGTMAPRVPSPKPTPNDLTVFHGTGDADEALVALGDGVAVPG